MRRRITNIHTPARPVHRSRSFTAWATGAMGALLAMAAPIVWAQSTTITSTPHDLRGAGADEVCVFCHTPHGANLGSDPSNAVAAPLWNRVFATDPTAYQTYADLQTSTLDGAEATVGSVSVACLSCHDGAQGTNVVINAPGSGNYNIAGVSYGGNGPITTGSVAMLGTDLRNDHPISIQYAGGGYSAATPTLADASQQGDVDFVLASNATINGNPAWWVDTTGGVADSRDKTDMILYARNDVNVAGGVQPFVECGSCHDPHNNVNGTFLRISNTGSNVCLSCHVK